MQPPLEHAAGLYIELLKLSLTGMLTQDPPEVLFSQNKGTPPQRGAPFDPTARSLGLDWPKNALTMVGIARMDNIQSCVVDVLQRNVPGDLIETGVWRGGATIFMRGILKAFDDPSRRVWVADSFQGVPPPNPEKYPADEGYLFHTAPEIAISMEQVKQNFERYQLLDERVRFLPGWFKDTLPQAPIEQLSVLRLDGDLYESTMDALSALYPKLSPGGYAIIDDYHIDACSKAVSSYRAQYRIADPIREIDGSGVFWMKTR